VDINHNRINNDQTRSLLTQIDALSQVEGVLIPPSLLQELYPGGNGKPAKVHGDPDEHCIHIQLTYPDGRTAP
jgi:hypothetical protein